MCEIVNIGIGNAFICDAKKDHECDKKAIIYEKKDGKRFFFTNTEEADKFIDENHKDIVMGSVACSICESAAIDKVRWF